MNNTQDILDVRNRLCPLPVLDTYRHLKDLSPGETCCILTADADSQRNFRAFCRQAGHEFVEARPQEYGLAIYIRKRKKQAN